eukprot:Blabericola_migrator_1__6924@NODE_3508_length_1719_cov_6_239104_g2178_i0_p1_GENE_NODE_3508_length_1719_cov_6_239104_g2178_i0NODE_3508_length_1719_cov_6_239104_g2178_i0_p1_ORF_typecomplete_len323_score26_28_NODE_3508_length_1719_cov_6_239104_g2178_i05271495
MHAIHGVLLLLIAVAISATKDGLTTSAISDTPSLSPNPSASLSNEQPSSGGGQTSVSSSASQDAKSTQQSQQSAQIKTLPATAQRVATFGASSIYLPCSQREGEEVCVKPASQISGPSCIYVRDLDICLPRCSSLPTELCETETMCYSLPGSGECVNHCSAGDLLLDVSQQAITPTQLLGIIQRDTMACGLCTSQKSCEVLASIGEQLRESNVGVSFPHRTDDFPEKIECHWTAIPSASQLPTVMTELAKLKDTDIPNLPQETWKHHVCMDRRFTSVNFDAPTIAAAARLARDIRGEIASETMLSRFFDISRPKELWCSRLE